MQKQQNNTYNQTKKENVIARSEATHPRVASLALRAIHLLAIPWIFRHLNWCFPLSTGLPRAYALAMTCSFSISPSNQNTVTVVHLVLDDLGGPAGEGFDPFLELLVVPADLDLLIALTLPGAAQQAQAALLGLIFPLGL